MARDYFQKTVELEDLKERNKIIRQLQQSKRKLLYENPESIGPFIKEKISNTLMHKIPERSYRSPEYVPYKSPTPVVKSTRREETNYLEIMKEQRALVERELQLMRIEEEQSRRDFKERLENLMRLNEEKTSKRFDDIRNNLQTLRKLQADLPRKSKPSVIDDLKELRRQYIYDGGTDIAFIHEVDAAIADAESHSEIEYNRDSWRDRRRDIVLVQEKANEIRDLERQIFDMENKMALEAVVKAEQSKTLVTSYSHNQQQQEQIQILHETIEELQKQIDDLKRQKVVVQPPPMQDIQQIMPDTFRDLVLYVDYVSGIGEYIRQMAVSISLYQGYEKLEGPVAFDIGYVRPSRNGDLEYSILLNIKQQFPSCPVSIDAFILLEIKVKSDTSELKTVGWTRLNVSTETNEPRLGSHCQSLYKAPLQPHDMRKLNKYHRAEIHYRLVDQSLTSKEVVPDDELWPPVFHLLREDILDNKQVAVQNDQEADVSDDERSDVTTDLDVKPDFGFQIIRVKNFPIDETHFLKLRLTVYYSDGPKKGHILMASEGPVTCTSNAVREDFKTACFQFGRQIAKFNTSDLSIDCILVVRFYVVTEPVKSDTVTEDIRKTEEELTAWTAIPLLKRRTVAKKNPSFHTDSLKLLRINRGIHDLPIYEPPALPPTMIFFDKKSFIVGQKSIGRARLKLALFHTKQVREPCTSSDNSSSESGDERSSEEKVYIPVERVEPLVVPYLNNDGMDLYLDGGRFFPDSVTIVKIEGTVVDQNLNAQGTEFFTKTSDVSDIYNPDFNERIEIRNPSLSPTATILLKVMMFDRESKSCVMMGYSALAIFKDFGSQQQPSGENLSEIVCLNDGGHQIRVYQSGPSNDQLPFSELWFKEKKIQPIPAVSLLIRLLKPPKHVDGRAMNIADVPTNYHKDTGIIVPRPKYEDGYYESMSCQPTKGEHQIMIKHSLRPKISLKDLLSSNWFSSVKETVPVNFDDVFQVFTSLPIGPFSTDHVAQYFPSHGFKISVDGALNIPWSGFTLGHLCLYPPGALYLEKPLVAYDRPYIISDIDLYSTVSAPLWKNGWKTYRRRKYNKYLVAILHLHELTVTVQKNDFKFSLENQAWTPIQIFDGPFCVTKVLQMPLINGPPKQVHFTELQKMPVKQFLTDLQASKQISFVPSASVIVRQCDSRRELEVPLSLESEKLTPDQSYIPAADLSNYRTINRSKGDVQLISKIPAGYTVTTTQQILKDKFQEMIYKLYDQSGFKPA